jgi:hypothetical protein
MRTRTKRVGWFGAIVALATLSACDPPPPYPKFATNQALRTKLFQECLSKLPSGPLATTFNDWSEVVGQCESAAYYQAQYCYADCPPPPKSTEND